MVRLVIDVRINMEWKDKNKKYLNALQTFLDKAENIENEELRLEIINQVLKCDEILTELAINEIYKNKKDGNNK